MSGPGFLPAEVEVIAAVVADARYYPVAAAVVSDTDFAHPALRAIWQAVAAQHQAGLPVDYVSLAMDASLRGPLAAYPTLLQELPVFAWQVVVTSGGQGAVRHHATLVRAESLRRQRATAAERLAQREKHGEDTSQLIAWLTKLDQQARELTQPQSTAVSALAFEDLFSEPTPVTLPSSLAELCEALGGGYQSHSYSLLCGGTKHGKSSLALQEARHLAEAGWPVLVVSVEMRRRELLARLAAQRRAEPWRKIWLEFFCEARGADLAQALAGLGSLNVLEFRPGLKLSSILDEVKRMSDAAGRPCFVVLDYLQRLLSRTAGDRDPRAAQGEISDMLAEASRNLGAHFLVLSSVGRPFYSERSGERSDDELAGAAKEGGGVEYDAGLVLVLRKGRPMPAPDRRSRATLRLAAQRFAGGGATSFKLIFDGGHNLFVPDLTAGEEDPLPKAIVELLLQPRHRTGLTIGALKQQVEGRAAQIIVSVRELAEAGEIWCSGVPGAPRVVYRHLDYAPKQVQQPLVEAVK